MIQKLIVNADDFGLSQGNTIGIVLAHQQGIVTSTTCLMNMPYTEFALQLAHQYPSLGVGVHLTITVGKPLIEGKFSYTDDNGFFKKKSTYIDKQPHAKEEELYYEWKAQIEKFIAITGHKPTHIDSHHHVHLLPWHQDIAIKLAKEYDIPMRQREHILETYEYVRCDDRMYDDDINYAFVTQAMSTDDEILELMCHPALLDQRLYDISSYSLPRMKELELLSSPQLKQFIHDHHIALINFHDIQKTRL